jgi:hypothetical protein
MLWFLASEQRKRILLEDIGYRNASSDSLYGMVPRDHGGINEKEASIVRQLVRRTGL